MYNVMLYACYCTGRQIDTIVSMYRCMYMYTRMCTAWVGTWRPDELKDDFE